MKEKIALWGLIYNVSETKLSVLKNYINVNLKLGFIKESKSPCSSLVLFTPKKDKELWLCINYYRLNVVTIKNHYLIPLILNILD